MFIFFLTGSEFSWDPQKSDTRPEAVKSEEGLFPGLRAQFPTLGPWAEPSACANIPDDVVTRVPLPSEANPRTHRGNAKCRCSEPSNPFDDTEIPSLERGKWRFSNCCQCPTPYPLAFTVWCSLAQRPAASSLAPLCARCLWSWALFCLREGQAGRAGALPPRGAALPMTEGSWYIHTPAPPPVPGRTTSDLQHHRRGPREGKPRCPQW